MKITLEETDGDISKCEQERTEQATRFQYLPTSFALTPSVFHSTPGMQLGSFGLCSPLSSHKAPYIQPQFLCI